MTSPTTPGVTPYPTLLELRAEHARLLADRPRQSDESNAPEFLRQVVEFIRRGAATGAYIDDEEDRRGVQSLLDFWANILYRANSQQGIQVETPDPTLADFDFSLAPELPDEPCPYRGLEAFREANSDFFFGREQLVDQLLRRLERERLLALVGSSGSGKSSVVFGGLLPRLKRGTGAQWRYLTMVPGETPLSNLAQLVSALADQAHSGESDPVVKSKIASAEDGFRRHAHYLADLANDTGDEPLVLVVDQFEEAFTLCTDDEARRAFANQLIGLAQTPRQRHIVILTMRSDFVDSVARLPALKPLFDQAQVDVRAMGIEELRAAIEKPAERVGLKFDPGIVSNLIETILGEQAGLPLLQFTLLKLWEKRKRNRITQEVYREVGDPRQALSRSAEAFYDGLIFQNQVTARLILMKMVRPALEGGREFTSNRIPLASAFQIGEPKDRVEEVLRRLIFEQRLVRLSGLDSADSAMALSELATQRGPRGEVPQIEVAHEALVRNWPRLVAWLDEARVDLRKRFAFTQMAREWMASSASSPDVRRDASLLLRGRLLEDAEAYHDLSEAEREFVQASRDALLAEERAREAARQREIEQTRALAEAERRRAEEQQRANASLRRLTVLLAGALALSIGLALAAWLFAQEASSNAVQANMASTRAVAQQSTAQAEATNAVRARETAQSAKSLAQEERQRATSAERIAESHRLAAQATDLLNVSVLDSLRTAIAAVTTTLPDEPPQDAIGALRRVLALPLPRLRLSGHQGAIVAAQFSPDGTLVATASADGALHLWERANRKLIARLKARVTTDRLAGRIRGAWLNVVPPPDITPLQFSPDGAFILTADAEAVRIWRVRPATGAQATQPVATLQAAGTAINGAAFSPDSRLVVTAGADQEVRIWDVRRGQVIARLRTGHTAAINTVTFSPDGALVLTASDDGTARLWDVRAGQQVEPTLGREGDAPLKVARFAPDGSSVLTAGEDGVIRLWAVASAIGGDGLARQLIGELRGHEMPVRSAEFSPDGSFIVTASDDGTARVWDARRRNTVHVLREHRDAVLSVHVSRDGHSVLTAGADGLALVWNLQPATLVATLQGHSAGVNSVQFSADGQRILTAGDDRTARIWSLTGQLILTITSQKIAPLASAPQQLMQSQTIKNPAGAINEAQFSPDGARIVLAAVNSTAIITDLRGGPAVALPGHRGPVLSAAFSPDGGRVATASEDGAVRVWDARTGLLIYTLQRHFAEVESVAFSSDGRILASASADGTARLWDAAGNSAGVLRGHKDVVRSVAFSPDGARLATASQDGTARSWDVRTGEEQLRLTGHESGVNGVAFSPDGRIIATAGSDRLVRLWDAQTGSLLATLTLHTDRVLGVAFSPDGRYIATASADGTARLVTDRLEDLLAIASGVVK